MDHRRTELLRAAARVYAKHGYRGSTTRRIADEAGINEVTIFRQFGSKDALMHEAIATCGGGEPLPDLPTVPTDPLAELAAWSDAVTQHLRTMRALIRRCMSEQEEHPQLCSSSNATPLRASAQLRTYLSRLREHGLVDGDFDVKAAAAMLMGALFSDAMGRDAMPEVFPAPSHGVAELYTRLLLRAIGVNEHTTLSSPTT